MKYILPLLAALILIACGSTSNMMTYRPRGSTESAWNVRAEKGNVSNSVQVFINDSLVCEGGPGVFSSDADLKGEYRGHAVTAMVQRSTGLFKTGIRCMVFIDGELAGKFEW